MALETVELIRKAEAEAADIIAAAKADAKKRAAKAADECNALDKEAVGRAAAYEADALKKAANKAAEYILIFRRQAIFL